MTDVRTIPVAYRLPETHVWDAVVEERRQEDERRCQAFRDTGRHAWQTEPTPTFMCDRSHPSQSWMGYMERCVSPAPYVDRHGQHNDRCDMLRNPEDDCIICGRYAEFLCDAPRCDVLLCDTHRVAGYRGMDFCPDHVELAP